MGKVLTVIPAKGRSRRVPGKNLSLVGGKPLVALAIEQAINSGVCGEICVATDSQEVASVALAAGARIPFLRTDDVDDVVPVGVAALNVLKRYRIELGMCFDYLCLLLPTSPLRQSQDIISSHELLLSHPEFDAVISLVKAEKHPAWAWCIDAKHQAVPMFPSLCNFGRHQLEQAYYVDGTVYWVKADFFEEIRGNQYSGRVGGYIMPAERAIDVDTPLDLALANLLTGNKWQTN